MIRAVLPHEVPEEWAAAAPFIRAAMEYTLGEDAEFLRAQAEDDLAQLWINGGSAAAITRVRDSKPMALEIVAIGGHNVDLWIGEMIDAWKDFAKRHGCKKIVATGRTGWKKIFKTYGFKIEQITGICEV